MVYKASDFSPRLIADSGQCFRMWQENDTNKAGECFGLFALGRLLRINAVNDTTFDFDCDRTEFDRLWRGYFDLDTDYAAMMAPLCADDPVLAGAVQYGRGMKLLRQDPWEMLISFIISQRKSIPAIRTCIEALCGVCGTQRDDSCTQKAALAPLRCPFPPPQQVAALTPDELRSCALGYRAEYIHDTATRIASGEKDLQQLAGVDTDTLMRELLSLRGVGPKVANCIMLFGYHRLECFPIDVWMARVIDQYYGGVAPEFGAYAGVAQQYLFYWCRKQG